MAITHSRNSLELAAVHKVPRRPYPAEAYKDWQPPEPVALKHPPKPSRPVKFPGFWKWLGNSRLVWFVCELPDAWKQAGRHSKSLFSIDDSWTLQ